jgi:ABC-type multidrug transport system fused ATPase/permease subunit
MNLFGKRQPVEPAAVDVDAATNVQPMKWNHEPETSASFLNGLFFLWIQPMFSRAAFLKKKGLFLEKEDLAPLAEMDKTENVERMFQNAYTNYFPNTKKPVEDDGCEDSPEELERRLVHSLIATCKRRIIEGGFFRLVNSTLQFSFPILLNLILSYYQDVQSGVITKDDPPMIYYKGYWLSILLMLFVQMKALTESAYFHRMNRCSWRIKTAISSSVYRKSLRLSSSAQRQTTVGEIVNLMQVDATKIEVFVTSMHTLWDGIFQIAGYMIILGFLLGWTCLVGLLLIIFCIPTMGIITAKMFGLNRSMVHNTDERVKTSNEALQGILCVKMYSWEGPLSNQIDKFRQEELKTLRKIAYLRAFSRAYMSALPTFAAASTFLVYVYATDRSVSASILFASIVAFDMLRFPLMFYPLALAQYAQCKVSRRQKLSFTINFALLHSALIVHSSLFVRFALCLIGEPETHWSLLRL